MNHWSTLRINKQNYQIIPPFPLPAIYVFKRPLAGNFSNFFVQIMLMRYNFNNLILRTLLAIMYDPSYRNKYRLPFISFYLSNFFNFHNFDKWSILSKINRLLIASILFSSERFRPELWDRKLRGSLYREKYYLPWRPIRSNSESGHAQDFSVSYYVTMVWSARTERRIALLNRYELSPPLQTVDSDLETIQHKTQRIAGRRKNSH